MWSDKEIAIARSQHVNLAFFLWVDQPGGPVRLFAGAGDWPLEASDTVDEQGDVYRSVGAWAAPMLDVDMVMNGAAQGVLLQREAVHLDDVPPFLGARSDIIGSEAAFGWGILDERFRLVGPVRWPLRGKLFKPQITRVTQDGVTSRMMGVTLMSNGYLRRRAAMAWQTDESQREREGDKFYARIRLLSSGTTRVLPG